jgi:ABC-2 type transport system permease protein/oleandomycin transport system permease protein
VSATTSRAVQPARTPAPSDGAQSSAREGVAQRLYWMANNTLVLTGRNLRMTTRIPELMAFYLTQPVVFVLLFRYALGGAIHTGGNTPYVDYLMAGIFALTVAFGGVMAGAGIAHDLQDGLLDRFCSLPISGVAVVLGRAIADAVRNVFALAIALLVGLAVGFDPHGSASSWLAAAGLLVLLGFIFSWLGACVGLKVQNVEAVQSANSMWPLPLLFASSAFVPTVGMPDPLRSFANAQPITKVVDATRDALLGHPMGSTGWVALAWLVGGLVVLVPVAMRLFRRAAGAP